MKKLILLFVFIFVLGVSLTACSLDDGNAGQEENQKPETPSESSGNGNPVDSPPVIADKTALLIIDIQNDYFEGGSHTLYNPLEALSNAEYILKKFRDEGLTVIHVRHSAEPGSGFMERGTWGAEIHENLTPLENETVIVKRQVSSFTGTELDSILFENGIKNLVICGMQTNVCVEGTIKSAKELSYEMILLEDACAAINPETHEKAIADLRELATVIKTNEYSFSPVKN